VSEAGLNRAVASAAPDFPDAIPSRLLMFLQGCNTLQSLLLGEAMAVETRSFYKRIFQYLIVFLPDRR
jgi:hypothetical protein